MSISVVEMLGTLVLDVLVTLIAVASGCGGRCGNGVCVCASGCGDGHCGTVMVIVSVSGSSHESW